METRKLHFDVGSLVYHKTDVKELFLMVVEQKSAIPDQVCVSWINRTGNLKTGILHVNSLKPAINSLK